MPFIGAKLKQEVTEKISESLKEWLPKEEFIVAFFKVSNHNPLSDVLVITNQRLLSVYVEGIERNKGYPIEIVADDIKDIDITKFTNSLTITLKDNTKKKIGMILKQENESVIKLVKDTSGSSVYLDINKQAKQKAGAEKQDLKQQKEVAKHQQENIRNSLRKEKLDEPKSQRELTDTRWTNDNSIITGKVNGASLKEIQKNCRNGELPRFILGDGINGVLAVFDDRCIVIKKGIGTSFMSSSLGGGRVATFAYSDITGIEYNSGIVSGVLEILTASYTGKTTNSRWTFGNDRSAHELSNTLPWGKAFYNEVRPQIEWLKNKVLESKTSSNQSNAPRQFDATQELTKVADLRKKGILTEKEFEIAKQKIIGKM